MFKIYRQEGCQFECRLRYSAMRANCTPWNYPVPHGLDDIGICTRKFTYVKSDMIYKSYSELFTDLMNDPQSLKNCDCLPNCEEVSYETQVGFIYLWPYLYDIYKIVGHYAALSLVK